MEADSVLHRIHFVQDPRSSYGDFYFWSCTGIYFVRGPSTETQENTLGHCSAVSRVLGDLVGPPLSAEEKNAQMFRGRETLRQLLQSAQHQDFETLQGIVEEYIRRLSRPDQ
jgi:hypothetical protein